MQIDSSLLLVSMLSGALTMVSPCILSLLPIIVGGSIDSDFKKEGKVKYNYKKALTVILSLAISVLFFTFTLKVSSIFINTPELFWKIISGGIIFIIGLIYLFPKIWNSQILSKLNIKSNILLGKGESKKSFYGNLMIGASLGPVFATCSPTYFIILATILPASLLVGSIYMLSYTIGMSLFLLFLSLLGSKILNKLEILTGDGSYFRKILGFLFVIVGLLIITSFDKKIEVQALENGYFDITKIERSLLSKKENTNEVKNLEIKKEISMKNESIKKDLPIAPEFVSPDGYINTNDKSITMQDFKNKKVVLVSIWTFSCINCKRTLPYLNSWYDKYKDQGLEIVGVHTPEFSFEKVKGNVEEAVRAQDIKYPVLLDNNYQTWNAYDNNYWPHRYLIDENGYILYEHIGEGDYAETELQIQKALKELNKN